MNALEINNLKKIYANGQIALRGIDLCIRRGDFFALLGPNGAGKSTTIGIISSLVNKSSGTVNIFGHDIDHELIQAKHCLGIVPQEINFSQFETCLQILLNQAGYYGIQRKTALERAEQYLGQLELWDRRNHVSRTLSGGLKRRLMIARALMNNPRLLVLDEPTAGVDVELRRSTWAFLKQINENGTTILLTTHYLEEAENLCKNIAIIDKGEIIEHSTMKHLLGKLNVEKFILDLARETDSIPESALFQMRRIDDTTLEIDLEKGTSMNNVFQYLSDNNIEISSMRNKSNRLEELFIRLLEKKPD